MFLAWFEKIYRFQAKLNSQAGLFYSPGRDKFDFKENNRFNLSLVKHNLIHIAFNFTFVRVNYELCLNFFIL